ncbi:MAG: NAD+ synthase [Gemmatimonadetes bacterium]|nr:NAD+ synthase [Gemmatimonadota bacterium]
MSGVRIVLAQINTHVGNLRGNAHRILAGIEEAERLEPDLIAFPELTVSGYSPEDLLERARFVHDCEEAVAEIARRVGETAVVIGFPHRTPAGLFNSAAILQHGKIQGVYHKMLLPNYGVFDEKRYFTPGDRGLVLTMNDLRIGFHVCEDSWWAEEKPTTCSAAAHVDAVLNISASPYTRAKFEDRRHILREVAKRTKSPIAYVNLVGGQDDILFDGGSVVVSSEGEITQCAKRFEEDFMALEFTRREGRGDPPADRNLCDWDELRLDVRGGGDRKRAPITVRPLPEIEPLEEEVYKALVLGTRDYLHKNGFAKAVIGLSGGIDSALVAAIATDALGSENVTGVTMPSEFTSTGTRTDAEKLAENLGIRFEEIPIGPVVDAFETALAVPFEGTERGIAEENIQARARGTLLMSLSNKFGWIVLNTGNKSESAVGYCTLYGDMCGGLAVIADVPKTLVYKVCRWRNEEAGRELIPVSTIERPPTAELRHDQKDSDSLPPYDFLDAVLAGFIEKQMSAEELIEEFGEKETVYRILKMVRSAEYKRRQAAPSIKITPRAFGRGRRIPITNGYSAENRFV